MCKESNAILTCHVVQKALHFSILFFFAATSFGQRADLTERSSDSLPGVFAGQGIMTGEVTQDSILVQLRLTSTDKLSNEEIKGCEGAAQFTVSAIGHDDSTTLITDASSRNDCIARVLFTDLIPNTRYRCTTRIGADRHLLHPGPTAEFKTLPSEEMNVPVSFAVVTGMNYARFHGTEQIGKKVGSSSQQVNQRKAYAGSDKHLGYPALKIIRNLEPDFFVGTGDNVYYDTPKKPRAKTLAQMRHKWQEQFVQPRFIDLFATVPTFWMVDDHDYRQDDCDNSGDYQPTPENGKRILLEQLPFGPMNSDDVKTCRTHRVNKDLQLWFTENRLYRSPNKMLDGPDKTIWGEQQKNWLKETLVSSDATYKVLVSPTPMVGPDDLRKKDNHCNVGGYRHERDEFFKFLKANGLDRQNFFIVCGDRHWQYHALDSSGFEEFSCGALIDANARLGRAPGDPAGTDPDQLIKQPYTQQEPSGGFLLVRCDPATEKSRAKLAFEFFDENGGSLYTCIK